MNIIRYIMNGIGLIVLSILFSCQAYEDDKCKNVPTGYSNFENDIFSLPRIDREKDFIKLAFDTILICYAKDPKFDPRYVLEIESVRSRPAGRYLIVVDLDGVRDVRLVYEVDRHGEVHRSFIYGM